MSRPAVSIPEAARCQHHEDRRGWPVTGSLTLTRLCDECHDEFGVEWTPAALAARAAVKRHELLVETSPRPWYIVGPPWNEDTPYIVSGSPDPNAGTFVCDLSPLDDPQPDRNEWADGELIVWLANRAEAFLELERAARLMDAAANASVAPLGSDAREVAAQELEAALGRLDGHDGHGGRSLGCGVERTFQGDSA